MGGLPFVNRYELAAADDVAVDRCQQIRAREPGFNPEVARRGLDHEL